jgi:hypothetical protein
MSDSARGAGEQSPAPTRQGVAHAHPIAEAGRRQVLHRLHGNLDSAGGAGSDG